MGSKPTENLSWWGFEVFFLIVLGLFFLGKCVPKGSLPWFTVEGFFLCDWSNMLLGYFFIRSTDFLAKEWKFLKCKNRDCNEQKRNNFYLKLPPNQCHRNHSRKFFFKFQQIISQVASSWLFQVLAGSRSSIRKISINPFIFHHWSFPWFPQKITFRKLSRKFKKNQNCFHWNHFTKWIRNHERSPEKGKMVFANFLFFPPKIFFPQISMTKLHWTWPNCS